MEKITAEYDLELSRFRAQIDEVGRELTSIENKTRSAGKSGTDAFDKTAKAASRAADSTRNADKAVSGLGGTMGKLAGFAAAAFSVGAIISFGKSIVDTTAKFQKFEAVLTNTLGSSSEAQKALDMIQQFAAKTPFGVEELTASFVKLANQGFKPTQDEMRKLGDLASSQGKSFDMLTEAIIDAQTGEFERLKEFGIRASKEGDNVRFSFKGVETQTKFTNDAIREYILGLGDLQGVSGGMAAISETLGGKISNLQDNIQALQKDLGEGLSPVLGGVIDFLNGLIDNIDNIKAPFEEVGQTSGEVANNLNGLAKSLGFVQTAGNGAETASKLLGVAFQILLAPTKLALTVFQGITWALKEIGAGAAGAGNALRAMLSGNFSNITEAFSKGYNDVLKNFEATPAVVKKAGDETTKIAQDIAVKKHVLTSAEKKAMEKKVKEAAAVQKKFEQEQAKKDPLEKIPVGIETLDKIQAGRITKMEENAKAEGKIISEIVEGNKFLRDEETKDILEQERKRQQAREETVQKAVEIGNALFELSTALNSAEIEELDRKKEKGILTEQQYAKQVAEIKRKQAVQDKVQAAFNIVIGTAQSIIKTGATLGYPAAIPLQILAGVLGAAQLAAVLAKPLPEVPAFEKGGKINGKEQLIRVNEKGEEFIANAIATRKHAEELEAMNKGGKHYERLLYKRYIAPALKANQSSTYKEKGFVFDDSGLRHDMKKLRTIDLSPKTVRAITRGISQSRSGFPNA